MSKADKRRPLVEAKWVDSSWHQGWKTGLETVSPSYCRTTGYLLRKSRVDVVIAMSVSDNGNFTEAMCIPRAAITSIRKVKAQK